MKWQANKNVRANLRRYACSIVVLLEESKNQTRLKQRDSGVNKWPIFYAKTIP